MYTEYYNQALLTQQFLRENINVQVLVQINLPVPVAFIVVQITLLEMISRPLWNESKTLSKFSKNV